MREFFVLTLGIMQLRNAISGDASHDAQARYPPPKCHPATRKAVLGRIMQWIASPSPNNCALWLYGPAGAGKSAIAQTIAERTEGRELAASFFFSRGNLSCNTVQPLWATIAFQIATSIPDLRNNIGTAVMDNPGIFFKAAESQLQKLIIEPFRSHSNIESNVPQQSSFLVIIDGLDECEGDDDQCLILDAISRIAHTLHLPLRFIIASRPEPHIRSSFINTSLQDICYRIVLDESIQPVQDVLTFLQSEFDAIYKKHQHAMTSVLRPWPSKDDVRLLADRSGGQFIYASTALKFIDDRDFRPAEQLKIVLDASGSTAFTALDQLYQQILSTSANIPLLLRILGCILMAKEDLYASTIETFLELQEGDVHMALGRVHSLVNVPDTYVEPIRVHHKSLADFIFNSARSGKYHISAEKCHLNLAVGCLRWALDAGRNYDHTLCRHSRSGVIVVSSSYARRHWADHCSTAEPKQELARHLMVLDHRSWSNLLHDDRSEVCWVSVMKLNTTINWLKV
jgi:NACHT domain